MSSTTATSTTTSSTTTSAINTIQKVCDIICPIYTSVILERSLPIFTPPTKTSEADYEIIMTLLVKIIKMREEYRFSSTNDLMYKLFDRFLDEEFENGGIVKHSMYKFTGEKLAAKFTAILSGITDMKIVAEADDKDFKCHARVRGQAVYFIAYDKTDETAQPFGIIFTSWSQPTTSFRQHATLAIFSWERTSSTA